MHWSHAGLEVRTSIIWGFTFHDGMISFFEKNEPPNTTEAADRYIYVNCKHLAVLSWLPINTNKLRPSVPPPGRPLPAFMAIVAMNSQNMMFPVISETTVYTVQLENDIHWTYSILDYTRYHMPKGYHSQASGSDAHAYQSTVECVHCVSIVWILHILISLYTMVLESNCVGSGGALWQAPQL